VLVLAGGCSREQQDWRSAESADTIEGYDQFIQKHPESELTTQARARVAQLGEERDWQRAGSADNVEAYRQFLAEHPNGKWAQEARIRIENFSLSEQANAAALSKGGSAAPEGAGGSPAASSPGRASDRATRAAAAGAGFSSGSAAPTAMQRPTPQGPGPQSPPAQRPESQGGYAVQLGAFKTEAAAQSEWRVLKARFGAELGALAEHIVAAETASGRIYRLQARVSDEGRARALCASLTKHSQPCVAVLPH
jgi:cell division septation protein DedD